MCSLIPDQLRSPEVGYSLTADGASAAASPRSLEVGQGEGGAVVKDTLRFCGSLATTVPKLAILGLKDEKSWSEPDFSALWCGKVWFKVVGGQL